MYLINDLMSFLGLLGMIGGTVDSTCDAAERASGQGSVSEISGSINSSVLSASSHREAEKSATGPDGANDAIIVTARTRILSSSESDRPKSGYLWLPKVAQFHSEFINQGGWNQSPSGNDGRTGVAAFRVFVEQHGNGDAGAYYANCQIGGAGRAGGTHWLAQPACVILNGDVATTVPHSYLNVQEFSLSDNGHDVAGIGTVYRFERTENAATQGEIWMGLRNQSTGSKAVDVGVSNAGVLNIGMDTVTARADSDFNFGNVVSLNMAAGQKIIYNSTSRLNNGINWFGDSLGTAYDAFSQTGNELSRCNGSSCLSVGDGTVVLANAGLRLAVVSAADLPACGQNAEGVLYGVKDAKSSRFNADLAGGGGNHVMAYCDGSRWKVR